MTDELPEGWAAAELGQICSTPQYGWTCKAAKRGKVKYLRTSDISNGEINWDSVPFCEQSPPDIDKYRIRADDILVSRAGSVGVSHRVKVAHPDTVFASYLIRFSALKGIEPRFVEWFLKSDDFWHSISRFTAGIAIPNVNASKLASLELPVAPNIEQQRIISKLESVLAVVDTCKERLSRIPKILKRFRRAVLAAACDGRLTADWRGFQSKNKFEQAGLPVELPETWRLRPIESVCDQIVDCPHSTPKWASSGRVCIRTTNFKPGQLDLGDVRYVSEETFNKRIERLRPEPGDVVYSREGGILGVACMIPPNVELCLGQRMMLFRTTSACASKLLMYWLNSPAILTLVQELTGGTASPHLNVGDVRNFPVPVPPIQEQHEIISRIEILFSHADRIEERYKSAVAAVNTLSQCILTKAFRGELVPTEAELAKAEGRTYEPAVELLERVRFEQSSMMRKRKARA